MKNSLLILSVLFLSSSCATIMTGKTQEVTFDSEPQGAEVAVNGRVIGKTPTTIQLDKKKDQMISVYDSKFLVSWNHRPAYLSHMNPEEADF